MFFRMMPGAELKTHNNETVYQWGPISLTSTSTDALSDAWPRYNFLGYEEKGAYREYRDLVLTMQGLGEDPQNGCGRALWENNSENGKYGTTMALMLLPHWTDGCIASMEGLFFEASGTTPYHFVTTAAMSQQSSNPVRQLRYDNTNAALGVPYLQTLGVKYVMVQTEAAKNQANLQPELSLVASSGPWNVYAVAGSELVEPLAFQPVVVNGRGGDPRERNLELGMSWFQHRDEWAAMPADDGPDEWQRIDVAPDLDRRQDDRVDIVEPVQPIEASPAARGDHLEHRARRAGPPLHRRPDRCARARQGQLLPELGGQRRRRAVSHRPEPDGRHPDRHRGAPHVRALGARHLLLPAHLRRPGAARVVAVEGRRRAPHRRAVRNRCRQRRPADDVVAGSVWSATTRLGRWPAARRAAGGRGDRSRSSASSDWSADLDDHAAGGATRQPSTTGRPARRTLLRRAGRAPSNRRNDLPPC